MNKLANVPVTIAGKKFELRCTGAALARLEAIYGGVAFTEAVQSLVKELESRKFKISRLAEVFCALAVTDKDRDLSNPGKDWVLDRIDTTSDTVAIGEAIAAAVMAHFPSAANERSGNAGDETDPSPADKA